MKRPEGLAQDVHTSQLPFLPRQASSMASQVDTIAITWLIFSVVVLTLVFGMIGWFCFKFRNREYAVRKLPKGLRNRMEWSWTIALTLIAVGIGLWADKVYVRMHLPPPGATPIYVVAKQWMWKTQHEDGIREINALHVPVGETVELIMSSQDVIHSFFVPEFRIKQDVVPGRYTYLWFKATRPGVYRLFCSQYCGTSHSMMTGQVFVMKPADYENWKKTQVAYRAGQSGSNLASLGRELFTQKGCVSCHETNGKLAPDLDGVYMSKVGLRTGEQVIADEDYLRESILNPQAKIVEGYNSIMPSFQGQLSEDDLAGLITYIKSRQFGDRSKK